MDMRQPIKYHDLGLQVQDEQMDKARKMKEDEVQPLLGVEETYWNMSSKVWYWVVLCALRLKSVL
eukprot:5904045-Amphidinium_carterae.1